MAHLITTLEDTVQPITQRPPMDTPMPPITLPTRRTHPTPMAAMDTDLMLDFTGTKRVIIKGR